MKKVSFRIDEKLLSEKMDLGGFSSYSSFLREAVEKYNPRSDAIISSESLKHFKSQIGEIHTILKSLKPSNTLTRLTPPNTYKHEPNSLPPSPPPKSHINTKPTATTKVNPTVKKEFSSFNEGGLGAVSPRTAMLAELKHKFSECSDLVSELLVSVPETEQKISKLLNYRLNKKAET